jgi:hypothetical protein
MIRTVDSYSWSSHAGNQPAQNLQTAITGQMSCLENKSRYLFFHQAAKSLPVQFITLLAIPNP